MKKGDKVLIVEENPFFAQAIEAAGDRFPVTCDRACDGWEAIEKLETEQYAAIVIDSDMPRHSGFGVLTYLREEVGDQLDNVIIMTTTDEDTLRRKLSENKLNVVSRKNAVDALTRVLTSE
ncbi:MAG TPA: response regulator [Thermoanaerobaculia bacterium]|jgi:CheY-like chemotaxis protein|nr:response regulator [Thermoanaerobaculia bacterium]